MEKSIAISTSEDDCCREINNRQNANINANFKLKRTKRRLYDDKIIINTVTLCYTLFGILLCVGTYVEANHQEEPILFQNRHWTDDERSAIATIERASKPIVFPEEHYDNHLQSLSARNYPPVDEIAHRFGSGESQSHSGRNNGFRFPYELSVQTRSRTGRVLNNGSVSANNNVTTKTNLNPSSRESQQIPSGSAESSRKASPDVQDIIDGIVKLLGGKVHNGTPPTGQGQYIPGLRPPPVVSSPNPAYNLFNPTKPMFFPTSKPTRINNRGPPIPINNNGNTNNNNNQQSPVPVTPLYSNPIRNGNNPGHTQPGSSFEAIPLEALNTDFNLNKSNFGPPFPLSKVPSAVEAPYKKGVPLPEQLVPTNDQNYYNHNNNNNNGNIYGNPNLDMYHNSQYNLGNYDPTRNNNNNPSHSSGEVQNSNNKKSTTSSSLLVPVTNKPDPYRPPVTTHIEDDEADDLRFTTNPNLLTLNTNNKTQEDLLEPTVIEESSLNPSNSHSGHVEFPSSNNNNNFDIKPTSTAQAGVDSVYPTLVLSTNKDNGLVEIVTKYNTISSPIRPSESFGTNNQNPGPSRPPIFYPNSNLNKQVEDYNLKHPSTTTTTKGTTSLATTSTPLTSLNPLSIHSLPTPPLRPGIVISDTPSTNGGGQGVGSVEVVVADETHPDGQAGEIFDVTVTAKQSYGGQVTGQPFVVPVDLKDDVITAPNGEQQFVSIDGKRTYFNLHPSTAAPAIGSSRPTQTVTGTILPVLEGPAIVNKNFVNNKPESKPNPSIGVGSVGAPVPLLPQPPGKTLFNSNTPVRPVSTSLSISPGSNSGSNDKGIISVSSGNKTPPNIIRRPLTRRPAVPPVRIDTCIVGDDSTCNSEQHEVCRTENGVSSCVCRSGYARRRHRETCKAIVSLVMSIKLDKLGDKKLSYNPDYFNPNSEIYQSIEWETIHALDSAMGETTLSGGYVGSKLDAIGFDGKHAVVNTTVLIQDNQKMPATQLKKELQKQMIQVLTRNRNNFGKSQLWVEGPISAVSAITDLDECEEPEMNDCHSKARCINTLGSFECKCEDGYGDPFENDKRRSGRRCDTCNGKTYCNARGDCLIENGQKVCKCAGNYYGSQCDIDGEVLAVAIGASVSAVVIIGLTLACLCMWSRKWKKEEQKAALMSRTLFGGMATQALSYLGGGGKSNPYQQHVSMDERLRWAQVADSNMSGNIYVQNDPMSMHTSPTLMGPSLMETPPMMQQRRSAETVDTTVDDIFDERQNAKRPRSRSSQMQGGIYYDLEPEPQSQQCQSDIYASRSMMHFPAQFCVPMTPMGHYATNGRGGFYT